MLSTTPGEIEVLKFSPNPRKCPIDGKPIPLVKHTSCNGTTFWKDIRVGCSDACSYEAKKLQPSHYANRRVLGACLHCPNPPVPGKRMCQSCLDQKAKILAKRIARGICVDCAKPAVPGKQRCQDHIIKAAKRLRKRRDLCSEQGRCTRCTNPNVPGNQMCRSCQENASKQHRLREYKYTEAHEQRFQSALTGEIPCDFCGHPFNGEPPHQDHDHSCCSGDKSCGKCLRGLVHRQCNLFGITFFEWLKRQTGENDPRLQAYRDKFPSKNEPLPIAA